MSGMSSIGDWESQSALLPPRWSVHLDTSLCLSLKPSFLHSPAPYRLRREMGRKAADVRHQTWVAPPRRTRYMLLLVARQSPPSRASFCNKAIVRSRDSMCPASCVALSRPVMSSAFNSARFEVDHCRSSWRQSLSATRAGSADSL
jgi:hypothetical protein